MGEQRQSSVGTIHKRLPKRSQLDNPERHGFAGVLSDENESQVGHHDPNYGNSVNNNLKLVCVD